MQIGQRSVQLALHGALVLRASDFGVVCARVVCARHGGGGLCGWVGGGAAARSDLVCGGVRENHILETPRFDCKRICCIRI